VEAFAQLHNMGLAAATGNAAVQAPAPSFSQLDIDAIERVMAAETDTDRLGIASSASTQEINKAYKGLATTLHPDKNRAPGAEEAFKYITQARTSLMSGQRV
jgi:DnaJ family protein B protein 12